MKIDERVSNYMALMNNETSKLPSRPKDINGVPIAQTPSVAVNISSTAVQLSDDEARRERLNSIRQQLAAGSYNISGKDVADKMLKILKS
jgi:anti-sigma28 factor (negative regulator of flagellin synthesis)